MSDERVAKLEAVFENVVKNLAEIKSDRQEDRFDRQEDRRRDRAERRWFAVIIFALMFAHGGILGVGFWHLDKTMSAGFGTLNETFSDLSQGLGEINEKLDALLQLVPPKDTKP